MEAKRTPWVDTEPDVENQIYNRKVSPDGKLFIGIYKVLFGFRIRAGYVGRMTVEVDWCCGDQNLFIMLSYNVLLKYLEMGGDIDVLPTCSEVKPWFNDPKFIERLGDALDTVDVRIK